MGSNIDELTLRDLQDIAGLFNHSEATKEQHPMVGRNCIVRCYSAGVHWGEVVSVHGTEVHLKNSLRIWKWVGGGLALGTIARIGLKGGRVERTDEVYLSEYIELIPTNQASEATYVDFIEE